MGDIVRLKEAKEKITEAKRLERKLGTTFYKVVTDTTTGDRKIVPVYQHGMPASFGSIFTVPDTLAMLVGAASTLAIFQSGKTFQKALVGKESVNKKQKRYAAAMGLTGLAGFFSLAPLSIRVGATSTEDTPRIFVNQLPP